jgi:hypothetical protein
MFCRYGLPRLSSKATTDSKVSPSSAAIHHSAEIEVYGLSKTSPLLCSCGRTFTSTRDYNRHKRNPLISPPAIMDAHIHSGPLINEESFISNCLNYFINLPRRRTVPSVKYWVYCLVGVPVKVYRNTAPFNIQTYMTDCLQRKEPILVYIGKCSKRGGKLTHSSYHTDVFGSLYSSVGKSIMLQTIEWFHVRSQAYRTAEHAEIAEALAQVFVNWRCHTSTHEIKYKPAWVNTANQTFQSETTVEEKFGLLKMYKDVENVDLFCTGCLSGTCTKSHNARTQLFHGEPLVRSWFFSGNWNVHGTDLLPLRIRCVIYFLCH